MWGDVEPKNIVSFWQMHLGLGWHKSIIAASCHCLSEKANSHKAIRAQFCKSFILLSYHTDSSRSEISQGNWWFNHSQELLDPYRFTLWCFKVHIIIYIYIYNIIYILMHLKLRKISLLNFAALGWFFRSARRMDSSYLWSSCGRWKLRGRGWNGAVFSLKGWRWFWLFFVFWKVKFWRLWF